MPISREAFETKGDEPETIVRFLNANTDQAFTATELYEVINSHKGPVLFTDHLTFLVLNKKIVCRVIGTDKYYASFSRK